MVRFLFIFIINIIIVNVIIIIIAIIIVIMIIFRCWHLFVNYYYFFKASKSPKVDNETRFFLTQNWNFSSILPSFFLLCHSFIPSQAVPFYKTNESFDDKAESFLENSSILHTHSYQRELIPFLYVYLQITTNPVFAHCDISIAIRPKKLQSCRQQQENEKLLQLCLFLSYFSDVSKAFDIVAAIYYRVPYYASTELHTCYIVYCKTSCRDQNV